MTTAGTAGAAYADEQGEHDAARDPSRLVRKMEEHGCGGDEHRERDRRQRGKDARREVARQGARAPILQSARVSHIRSHVCQSGTPFPAA